MEPRAALSSVAADGSLVHVRELPARPSALEPLPADLPDVLVERLRLLGIEGLYPHQAEALERVRAGRNVVISTGTASGKSLVYHLAVAAEAVADPKRTALYLFPTKALARDQLRWVRSLRLPQVKAAVYDGDTPSAERPLIRRSANLLLSNPDMLHASLLPDHARWADFFLRLSLVVVDEAHVARGVFGSHVAMVLRRLRRLVAHYGGDPRFVLASATIGNPSELAERLVGVPFDAVTVDASPSGGKVFALYDPPVIDEESGARRSALTDASGIMARLAEDGIRSIGFARSRRAAELLAEFTRRELTGELRRRVKSYRAGYLPEDRRRLERELAGGELVAVASTNALELGIDIGSLDAAILVGYPGTRASMWQQAGRAGRRTEGSLAILVAQDDPLDQFLVTHPEELFDRPPEAAVIDPRNPFVLGPHLACAARELPLADEELTRFWPDAGGVVADLESRGELVRRRELLHHRGRSSPHRQVDIRSASGHTFAIVIEDTGELLGTVDEARAYYHVHPGAVYLHQGESFLVRQLDLDARVALVSRADPDHYTRSRDTTDIGVIATDEETTIGDDVSTSYGTVHVTNQVVAYVRTHVATGETLEIVPLSLPPQTLETKAVWWAIPQRVLDRAALAPAQVPGAAHAAEHAAIGLLPLVATCDRWDVGGVSTNFHPDTGSCAIFIYDGYPGGAGIA
ncbi:MAG TPA: DEAD/DEAH box helicase, partial [Actinomycetota bacterium]|nr:DEAD/DEAH box helicase [Actinomycetota bacterium]